MHVVDSGVAARLLRLTPERLARFDPVFNGLKRLLDSLGSSFRGGAVLYLGSRSYSYEDRLHALPLDRLWTPL